MADMLLADVERAYRSYFEAEPARASLSFLGVEPIDVLRFDYLDTRVAYVTLGMSRKPMSGDQTVITENSPRAELFLITKGDGADVWRQLAVVAASPVVEGLVLAPGARVDLGRSVAAGSRCSGFLVVRAELPPLHHDAITVDFLQVLPATSNEIAWARVHGSDALRERWQAQQVDLGDLARAGVNLY